MGLYKITNGKILFHDDDITKYIYLYITFLSIHDSLIYAFNDSINPSYLLYPLPTTTYYNSIPKHLAEANDDPTLRLIGTRLLRQLISRLKP